MLLLLRCVLRLKFFFLLQIVLCIELLKLADGAGISSQLWSCVQEEKHLVFHVSDFDFNSSQLSLAFLREDFRYVLALYPSHPDPAAEVFSIHHPEGFQSSLGISLLHFFLVSNTPLLPQFFLLQHVPLFFQSQPALCLLTCSGL